MAENYEITCARPGCGNITFSGPQRGAVDAALDAHVEAYHNYMTGQEWYERFDHQLKGLVSRGDGETFMGWDCGEVRDAAKKAAKL